MQKGSVLPFVILVIVVLGSLGGFYYYQIRTTKESYVKVLTTPVSESKKQIFTSDKFKFEFEYPEYFSVQEDSEEEFNKRGNGDFRKNFTYYVTYPPAKILGAVSVLDSNGSFDTNPFTVWVFENPDKLSIDKWYDRYWYYPFVWGDFTYTGKFTLAPKDEATVSGQMAKSGMIDYQPGKPKFVYLSTEKKMYLFRIIGESGDKILSTFKFLQ